MPTLASKFFCACALVLVATTTPVFAGPPLLCHPFDIANAPSLPWGGARWNAALAGFDLATLGARTGSLLDQQASIIARMETLRRAAIYASRDGVTLHGLATRLDARIAAAHDDDARALALFDTGYFAETLQEIERLQSYDMPGIGRVDRTALRDVLARGDGGARIEEAMRLRPHDGELLFAAALAAVADQRKNDFTRYKTAAVAAAAARGDNLLARNIAQIASE